jgi:hypothetical protein
MTDPSNKKMIVYAFLSLLAVFACLAYIICNVAGRCDWDTDIAEMPLETEKQGTIEHKNRNHQDEDYLHNYMVYEFISPDSNWYN